MSLNEDKEDQNNNKVINLNKNDNGNQNIEDNYDKYSEKKLWGLGIGDGDWAQSPIPNPQSPIPNPHFSFIKFNIHNNDNIDYIDYIHHIHNIFRIQF